MEEDFKILNAEINTNNIINKVVIWGYPLHKHTHSYIHYGWHKAFTYLGYKTYWFSKDNYSKELDYNNTLFITEGHDDENIPINATSIYFVHICIKPMKYYGKVKRLIDIRYLVDYLDDYNYKYVLKKEECLEISKCCYYKKLHNTNELADKWNENLEIEYEAIYMCWATDLLPCEIDFNWINIPRSNTIYWFASYDNKTDKNINTFVNECYKNNIGFRYNNPWVNPAEFDIVRKYTQESYMAPDIRSSGKEKNIKKGEYGVSHKTIGYIPCRLLKSISYGCLGITNSRHAYELLDKLPIYNEDEKKLFYDAREQLNNKELIRKQMELVRDKHTYINRINDLFAVLKLK